MSRADRGASRAVPRDRTPVKLLSGERVCQGVLVDFTPNSVAIRVAPEALFGWTFQELRHCTLLMHCEYRPASLARIQLQQTQFAHVFVVGLRLEPEQEVA